MSRKLLVKYFDFHKYELLHEKYCFLLMQVTNVQRTRVNKAYFWPQILRNVPNLYNKNIIMCSFKSSGDIQKKEGGPDSCFG